MIPMMIQQIFRIGVTDMTIIPTIVINNSGGLSIPLIRTIKIDNAPIAIINENISAKEHKLRIPILRSDLGSNVNQFSRNLFMNAFIVIPHGYVFVRFRISPIIAEASTALSYITPPTERTKAL